MESIGVGMLRSHVVLMAAYNEWMNVKLYEAAGKLPSQELVSDKKAFFHSISGTLNHILVADTIWLKRFAKHPSHHLALDSVRKLKTPLSLDELLFTDFGELFHQRKWLDRIIKDWAMELTGEDLSYALLYTNMKGIKAKKNFFSLIMHFFNHQTHHRGQVTTLLSQNGIDIGVTDLLALIPSEIET